MAKSDSQFLPMTEYEKNTGRLSLRSTTGNRISSRTVISSRQSARILSPWFRITSGTSKFVKAFIHNHAVQRILWMWYSAASPYRFRHTAKNALSWHKLVIRLIYAQRYSPYQSKQKKSNPGKTGQRARVCPVTAKAAQSPRLLAISVGGG